MKKKKQFKWPELQNTDFPTELVYKEPVFTVIGSKSVSVENYKSILHYTCEEICLKTSAGILKICGKGLEIPFYCAEEMQIEGKISVIFMESR